MQNGRRETGDGRRLVVGLGATGAAIVRYLRREGIAFVVTDSRAQPPGLDVLGDAPCALGGFACPVPLSEIEEAVVSPGISLSESFVMKLRAAGITIIGDIELFARALARLPSPVSRLPSVVGITGSNGKSTVTTLLGAMAARAGLNVAVGGNLGTPALDLLAPDVQLYVLELSSFQLETVHNLRCTAAANLNVSADHLDRHHDLAAYAAAKGRIFNGCELAVVNRDDRETRRNVEAASRVVSFGLDTAMEGQYGLLQVDGEDWLSAPSPDSRLPSPVLSVSTLKIHGLHNAANALAALALADAVGIPRTASLAVLHEFKGLRHRCEWVADVGGVTFFNDS
ncbi:MAG: UDP-N-acetylmuramoyl-L-alanine--D-glutamate ligase, partial [Nevskiales bacterium]|nr:UDP-N-acetylmuramoyl-L-alanine--D-glutamate ligase [Nevskiales bacterium]